MVEQVSLASLARQQAEKLLSDKRNKEKGVPDGFICKEVWDEFVAKTGVKKHGKIDSCINVANATKSIITYAKRVDNQNEKDIVQSWLNGAGFKPSKVNDNSSVNNSSNVSQDNTHAYKQNVVNPKQGVTAAQMAAHNAKVQKLEKEAADIVNNSKSGMSIVSNDLAKCYAYNAFSKLNKNNLAYVLLKEPNYIENVLEKAKKYLTENDKTEIVSSILKNIGSAAKTTGLSVPELIEAVKKFASAHAVERKYDNSVINAQLNKQRSNEQQALVNSIKVEAKPKTPNIDNVQNKKARAVALASQVRHCIKEDDAEGVKERFRSISKEQFPYILIADTTLLEAVSDMVSPNTLKVALKQKLGFTGNTDTMSVSQTIAKMKELMEKQRKIDSARVAKEEAAVKQGQQRANLDRVMSAIATLANPSNCAKPRPKKNEEGVNDYVVEDGPNSIKFSVDSNGNVVKASVSTVHNKKTTTVSIDAKHFYVNNVTVPNNNQTIMTYIKNNFPVK